MNNLTKTDLLTIFKCLRLAEGSCGNHSDIDNATHKIQKMIDNYCEYEIHYPHVGLKVGNHDE